MPKPRQTSRLRVRRTARTDKPKTPQDHFIVRPEPRVSTRVSRALMDELQRHSNTKCQRKSVTVVKALHAYLGVPFKAAAA